MPDAVAAHRRPHPLGEAVRRETIGWLPRHVLSRKIGAKALGEHVTTVGRLPECTISIGDTNVSRNHAEIRTGTNAYIAVDLGSTNGTLLDRGTRRFLARHGVETQISFDGVEAAQQLRAPGTFGRLDRALSRLRDEHPDFLREHCRVAITLSSRNLDHLAESFTNLVDRGVGEIVVSALVTHDPGWRPETIEELAAQIEEILNLSIEHFRRTGEVPFAPFRSGEPGDPPADGPPTMCSAAGTTSPAVDVDGQVYGCVMFAESYQTIPDGMLRRCLEPMRLGNIRAPEFGKRLEAYPAAAEAAKIFTNKEEKRSSYRTCRGCRFVNQCSVCPVSIGHIPGNTDPNRVPDLQCAFNLAVLAARDLFLQKSQSDDSVVAPATL